MRPESGDVNISKIKKRYLFSLIISIGIITLIVSINHSYFLWHGYNKWRIDDLDKLYIVSEPFHIDNSLHTDNNWKSFDFLEFKMPLPKNLIELKKWNSDGIVARSKDIEIAVLSITNREKNYAKQMYHVLSSESKDGKRLEYKFNSPFELLHAIEITTPNDIGFFEKPSKNLITSILLLNKNFRHNAYPSQVYSFQNKLIKALIYIHKEKVLFEIFSNDDEKNITARLKLKNGMAKQKLPFIQTIVTNFKFSNIFYETDDVIKALDDLIISSSKKKL